MRSELPSLLRVQELRDFSGLTRSQLQSIYPHLHILEMPHSSRRFAAPYLLSLAEHLYHTNYIRLGNAVIEFSRTDTARQTVEAAERQLDTIISAGAQPLPGDEDTTERYLAAPTAADALHLARGSITDWKRSGALETTTHDGRLYVAEFVLREAITWQQPEKMQFDQPTHGHPLP